MKKKLKAPMKLTKNESEKIQNWLWMADWHFEALFLKKCTEISSFIIHWNKNNKHEPEHAKVYGLQAIYTESKMPCIANIFIRYSCRVYRVNNICQAAEIIQLLEKEAKYEQHLNNVWEEKDKARRKVLAARQSAKIKKLKVIPKEKAA